MNKHDLIHLFAERHGQLELVQIDLSQVEGWTIVDHGNEEGEGVIELHYFDGQEDTVLVDPCNFRAIFDTFLLRGLGA